MSSPISIGRKNDEETGGKIGHAPEPEPDDDRVRESSHDWQYDDAVSSSGLTGGFTTITNVFEANGVGSGEQIYSPSRSIFEVVDIIDGYSMARTASIPRSNEGSKNDSFDSYYHMQKNGPPLIPDLTNIRRGGHNMRYGWRRGGLSEANASSLADTTDKSIEIGEHHPDDESDFNTNGASSLSSLTNDWVPKIARKGEHNIFTTPKRNRKQLSEVPGSTSPTSSNDKSNSQNSKIFPKSLTAPRKKRNNLVHDSPWYVNKHHSQSPSAKNSSQDKTPMASPPDEVLIAQCHRNKVSGVSEPSPSVISSSNLSQYFTNELREIYNSNVYRSYRHRYNQALSSPKAKRIILSSAVIAAIFAIVAIIAISLGTRQNDRSIGEVSTYDGFVPNNPLPEKCCVGNYNVPDDGGIVDVEEEYEMIEPSAAIHSISKPPSPSVSPVQNPVNKVDWDYVSGSNPTPGEDLIEWRPSVLPSWQPTKNPTKQPTSKYQTLKPSSTPSVPDYVLPTVIPKVLTSNPSRTPDATSAASSPSQVPTIPRSTNHPETTDPTLKPSFKPTSPLEPVDQTPAPNPKPTNPPQTDDPTIEPSPKPTNLPEPSPKPTKLPETDEPAAESACPPTSPYYVAVKNSYVCCEIPGCSSDSIDDCSCFEI